MKKYTRKWMVEDLVDAKVYCGDSRRQLEYILRNGFKGYKNLTTKEIEKEYKLLLKE